MLNLCSNLVKCLLKDGSRCLTYSSFHEAQLLTSKGILRATLACSPRFDQCRGKKTKQEEQTDSDSEDDEDVVKKYKDQDKSLNKISTVINAKANSNRLDHIIKAGLNISRNKSEVLFFESKIRVNGKKMLKKSAQVQVGDEVDVIKAYNKLNPKNLDVARLEILEMIPNVENIGVIMRRYKNMTIENYDEPFTGNID